MLRDDERINATPQRRSLSSESDRLTRAAEIEARDPAQKPVDDQADAADGDDKAADDSDREDEKKPGFIKRHPVLVAILALVFILGCVAFYFYWLTQLHPYESTDDAFIDSREFSISPKVAGYITAVNVTDNQAVTAGTKIVEIDTRDYQIAVEQAEAQVAASQATFQGLGPQLESQEAQIEEAKAQVVQAQAQLQFSQQDAARYQDLAARGAGTIQQAQQSTSNLQQQQANLSRAQAALTAAQKQIGSLQAQQINATANLRVSQAQLDQARLNLDYTAITAAQDGRVVRLSAAKGGYAQAGQGLMMFVPSTIWVTANYKETQITDMRPGQTVDIEVDAYPGRRLKGHLDTVQPGSGTAFSLLPAENATGNYVKVVQRIPVKIVFDEIPSDIVLGPGMSVVPRAHVR